MEKQNFKYVINLYNTENMVKKQTKILHYPRLDTILMIEEAIKKSKEYPSKRRLWLSLKKKVMYQTFLLVLEYLQESGKIVIDNGKIIWIWNPELVKKYMASNLVAR